jgi:molecular chaperone DnaK (HSP70)
MWALDLGTTNSVLTRWDRVRQRPVLVELADVCRFPPSRALPAHAGEPDGLDVDPLAAPLVIPTVVEPYDALDFWARVGQVPAVQRLFFLGRTAFIGREALERSKERRRPGFAAQFKPHLGTAPLRTVARMGRTAVSARECLQLFLRELLARTAETTGERIRELVVTSPVDAYESYRAEVSQALRNLGVRRVRFIDEPVAAALGYGLSVNRDRKILVVDFGGGTLDVAFVRLSPKGLDQGTGEVLGKEGRPIGGADVDRWLLQQVCAQLGYRDPFERPEDSWHRFMLDAVCAAKEQLFFDEETTVVGLAPDELERFEERIRGKSGAVTLRRDALEKLLADKGVFRELEACIDACVDDDADVDDVLMVGGSTLLPGVFARIQDRFGRDRVRAWQPFEAVAQGAGVYAAGRVEPSDFIVHDYAFVTHDLKTHEKQYAVVVPRGTRFPTPHDFWRKELVPTCSLGEPETMFKLVICELGRSPDGTRRFAFDKEGKVHVVGSNSPHEAEQPRSEAPSGRPEGVIPADQVIVVPLNESNPTLGYLRPPHPPEDKRPRLEIAFGVNSERWLCASVFDLKTRRYMMREEPVVRLM